MKKQKCGEACWFAKTPKTDCTCPCGGKNHGKIRTEMIYNNEIIPEGYGLIMTFRKLGLIYYDGKQLKQKKRNGKVAHEFEWGRESLGSRKLAYAILRKFSDEKTARKYCNQFSEERISNFYKTRDFTLTIVEVQDWLGMTKNNVKI